jgi:hypothetical protein
MTEPSRREMLASAGVAFIGVVDRLNASAIPDVTLDEPTAIVRVEQVIKAPDAIGLRPGATVTLRLAADRPPPAGGERALFLADGWIYAEAIALIEVGRLPAEPPATAFAAADGPEASAEEVLADLAQDEVFAHAQLAVAVVRARVVSLAETVTDPVPREHDPVVWVAALAVDLVAKGAVEAGTTVPVAYANSQDVRWRGRARLAEDHRRHERNDPIRAHSIPGFGYITAAPDPGPDRRRPIRLLDAASVKAYIRFEPVVRRRPNADQ